jgi:hypothetical protein
MIEWRLWTDNVIIHLGRIVADAATCTFLHEGRIADFRCGHHQGPFCGQSVNSLRLHEGPLSRKGNGGVGKYVTQTFLENWCLVEGKEP